ncbi:MAG: ribosome maturation factor RimM [Bdellovibrionaceae bacterium]|nr:ribosome maturation factor RimM [Pseudobdellovibrionaceae bacterium]MDW8191235.1 ribosome maturation factor RimM [Pseudobdellovibrionaceae bacterium]
MNKRWICIGSVLRPHGLRGDLYVRLYAQRADWYQGTPITLIFNEDYSDFLDARSSSPVLLRLVCQQIKPHKKNFLMRLEGITHRQEAERLKNFFIFLETHHLQSSDPQQPFLYEFLEATVYDKEKLVGVVASFDFNGTQDLLVVKPIETEKKDTNTQGRIRLMGYPVNEYYLIPLIKAFLRSWDPQKKQLILDLPQGLLDINRKKNEKI